MLLVSNADRHHPGLMDALNTIKCDSRPRLSVACVSSSTSEGRKTLPDAFSDK